MQHELFLLLSSHPSPLLASPLLHPGERTTLLRLSALATLHQTVTSFCTRSHPTSSLSALAAILTTRISRPYTAAVLALEERVLRGEIDGLPLALVMAEMGEWEGLLSGVVRLLDALERGPAALDGRSARRVAFAGADEDDEGEQEWTAAPLLTLLSRHSNTGLTTLASLLQSCISAISTLYLASLSSFLIWGLPGREPLVLSTLTPTSSSPSSTTYTFPPTSLPHLPALENPSTRTALLNALSTVCRALSVLHSLPTSSLNATAGPIELPRPLRHSLQSLLQGCTGPADESFPSRISSIETLLSTHLLTLHLPTPLLLTTLQTLSTTFLLRTPLATSLVSQLLLLRPRRSLSSLDLSSALVRAAGTELDDDDGSSALDAFRLVLSKEEGLAEDPFAKRLLGPSISLVYAPTPALALFLTEDALAIYGRIWGYLMAVRSCHARLLTTWASLAHAQRLRRRFTGASEGGVDAEEAAMREAAVRGVWGLVRAMVWWVEGVEAHFQMDVIDPALRELLERIGGEGGRDEKGHMRGRSFSTKAGSEGGEGERLDFTSLATLHALYLSLLLSGLLLNSEVLSGMVMEMMEICEGFCARVDRWGGDVLPGLLSGTMGDEESAQLVWERHHLVQEVNETFSDKLLTFFELLSSASTNPRRPTHPDTSLSVASISSTSLAFRPVLPVLPVLPSAKKSSASSTLSQNPIVAQARAEAELAAREFLPQLLLRLDFARWFSRAGERRERAEERERAREEVVAGGSVLQGLNDA